MPEKQNLLVAAGLDVEIQDEGEPVTLPKNGL